ncbi:MAG: DNA mismatch repair endonuclease MutL [Thermoanaerobaculia bacterium]
MPRIHFLDDRLISQIAAGEVVERPASVVKELIENSIDAGAGSVRVELEVGGKRRIIVADDGSGMDADDALLAFDRHATSKIASFEDLEQVATLGFRGEALASIAAVARVELKTAAAAGDGHLVRVEGGRVRRTEPVAHPRGTRIEVASLFYNVPARRKFLKRPQTELRRAVEVVQGYALAHPERRFTVVHEGRSLLETVPSSDDGEGLRERIRQVFGGALSARLTEIPLEFVAEEDAISGFVGNRDTARGRRIFLYVNRRLVRDRILLARFYRAVRDQWKSEDYPSLFLFLELPASEIDVNVHPQKSEVRFRDLAFIDRAEEALRTTLGQARGEEPAPLAAPSQRPVAAVWEGLGGQRTGGRASYEASGEAAYSPEVPASGGERRDAGAIAQASFAPPEPVQVPLSGRSGKVRPFRLLGQYKGSLILLEGPDGLYIIDQHVAHERLLYERMRRALEGERASAQNLLEPLLLELSAAEAMRLREMTPLLEGCGFALSPMSGNTVALTAIPTVLSIDQAEAMVQTLAASAGEVESDVAESRRRLLDALAASMACRAAVKIHHPMSVVEMQRLVSELFQAEQPYACPHGRPIVLQMGDVELERRFGRR